MHALCSVMRCHAGTQAGPAGMGCPLPYLVSPVRMPTSWSSGVSFHVLCSVHPRNASSSYHDVPLVPACTISAAKTHYGTALANVDWLHGSAESLLTVTNLLIGKLVNLVRITAQTCICMQICMIGKVQTADRAAECRTCCTCMYSPCQKFNAHPLLPESRHLPDQPCAHARHVMWQNAQR